MSTTLLSDDRQHTTIHPPDTGDRQILTIPDRSAQRRLALTDRLRLRLGLWLLERSLHPTAPAAPAPRPIRDAARAEHEAITLLTFDLQRGLR
ncbi:hypothetical protein ACFWHT_06820 [Microbacterium sp. NPDC058342]|uniref:hypothetical protein n=1 Tax=Microbacterium sp. NPDC058342 TaxID=3346454 RepID=UPI0036687C2C